MVDGCILVVDASEGVMSQTKFVVSRALQQVYSPPNINDAALCYIIDSYYLK